MNILVQKILLGIISFLILLSLFFVCHGVGMAVIMKSGSQVSLMPCCNMQASENFFGGMFFKLTAPISFGILVYIFIFNWFIYFKKRLQEKRFNNYVLLIKHFFGSFNIFQFWIRLFSQGILKPKIF